MEHCIIFDKITDSHRYALAKLRAKEQAKEEGSPDTPGPVDKVALLDLGDDDEIRVSRRKAAQKRIVSELPLAVDMEVDLENGKKPQALRALTCLGKTGRKAVAIELTVNNLRWLRGLVLQEISDMDSDSMATPGRALLKKPAARSPRCLGNGVREYWSGSTKKWVVKKSIGKGRYKCLTRKPTPVDPPPTSSSTAALPHQASGSDDALADKADALGFGD